MYNTVRSADVATTIVGAPEPAEAKIASAEDKSLHPYVVGANGSPTPSSDIEDVLEKNEIQSVS